MQNPSDAKVNKEWSYTFTLHIWLNGAHSGNFKFYCFQTRHIRIGGTQTWGRGSLFQGQQDPLRKFSAWTSVSCECCVLSGRGHCVGLITRPEEPYQVWCVRVWSWRFDNEEALAHWGLLRLGKKKKNRISYQSSYICAVITSHILTLRKYNLITMKW
jgi:hypothetical protein